MSNDTMTCQRSQSIHKKASSFRSYCRHSVDILGLSQDPHTPSHTLSGYLRHYGDLGIVPGFTHTMPTLCQDSLDTMDTLGLSTHQATPYQSIFGVLRHYDILVLSRDPHPPSHPLSELVSLESLDTMTSWDCPGIHTPYYPLSEYLRRLGLAPKIL